MRRFYLLMLIGITLLTACQAAPPIQVDATTYARQWLDSVNKQSAKITKVVAGNPKNHKADELWCVATDALRPDNNQAYLAVVWRVGSTWAGAELTNGTYDWDLSGCPDS